MGVALNYDATPPAVAATLARAPDSNGWFNHPVAANGSGTDGGSGLAGCTSSSYSGPDAAGVSLAVTCRDRAGNASGPAYVSLKYDATAPAVVATPDRPPVAGGWYRRLLTVSFAGTDATSGGVSCTGPVRYDGPDDTSARVVGSCRDAAGNSAEAAHAFRYDATAPRVGELKAASEKTADRGPLGAARGRRDDPACARARPERGAPLDRLRGRGPAVRRQGGARRRRVPVRVERVRRRGQRRQLHGDRQGARDALPTGRGRGGARAGHPRLGSAERASASTTPSSCATG